MKGLFSFKGVVAAAVLLGAVSLQATNDNSSDAHRTKKHIYEPIVVASDTMVNDTVDISKMSQKEYEEYLRTAPVDTTIRDSVTVAFSVKVLARPKGDRVLLRWAPDEFAPWYLANKYGYNILRMNLDEGVVDTIKKNLLPMSLEQMKLSFEPTDSLAAAAAQMLYGKGSKLNEAIGGSGADGIMQVYEEQQTRFAYAMLLSEIRPDIAEAMALMYVDKTAEKGERYMYIVTTNIPKEEANMTYQGVDVKNVLEKPAKFEPLITDSLGTDGLSMRIFWPMEPAYTVYDIECRYNGGEWKKLNERPFMTLMTYEDESVGQNIYEYAGVQPGTYEFRICGYDSFGEKSNYSKPHKVEMPDVIPPTAPLIKNFFLDRPTENTVVADIVWEKKIIEPDFVGYDIYYYNPQIDSAWVKLNDYTVAREDTVFRCEVTYLGTGRVTVVAKDTLGNSSASMPQEMFIADITPPAAPTNLEYVLSPTGSLLIKWERSKDADVAGYQLYYANDSTHTFLQKAGKSTRGTAILDTLAVSGVIQRYTYYRVKAYDFSGNESAFSDILTVKRKNYDPPRPCRVDSVWQDTKAVYMTWYPSSEADVEKFYVYRRLEGENISSLINVLTKDSVKNGRLWVVDSPQPNRTKRYFYHIETMNETGITSEPSFETSFLFKGDMKLNVKINLGVSYRADEEKVYVAWDLSGLTQEMIDAGVYFCLYKKWDDDDIFRHVESINIKERYTIDHHMKPGDGAEYRMRLRTKDGMLSPYSNVVRVTVPVKEEQKR